MRSRVRGLDGTPLEASEVRAYECWGGAPMMIGELVASAMTNSKGHYVLEHLNAESHEIRASHEGFETQSERVALDGSARSKEVDLKLGPGGVIEGVLVDAETGTPIAGAIVTGFPLAAESRPTPRDWTRSILSARSDERGRYRLEGQGRARTRSA